MSDGPNGPTPMVAIRSNGMVLDSVIGKKHSQSKRPVCVVSPGYLETLLAIANQRFQENTSRIARFRALLFESEKAGKKGQGDEWEDAAARRERKRTEGLKRSAEMRQQASKDTRDTDDSIGDVENLL